MTHHAGTTRCLRITLLAVLGSATVLGLPAGLRAETPVLQPSSSAWKVAPALSDEKESLNVSGVACQSAGQAQQACLLIGDEKRYARQFRLEGLAIIPGDKVPLLPKEENGVEFDETDAEGIAADGKFYYLVGSHGLNRKGELQPSRFFVFRIPVDPATGLPAGDAERSDRLRKIIKGTPTLGNHAEQPLGAETPGSHGVNIEGLAAQNGNLFLGFRGPVIGKTAYVLRVADEALFEGAPADAQLFPIKLGDGIGVRDLAAVEGGLLVLSGPEADGGAAPAVFLWDGSSSQPLLLGSLETGLPPTMKPEGLLVLDEDETGYRVLIFCDGATDGGPAEYHIPKRGRPS